MAQALRYQGRDEAGNVVVEGAQPLAGQQLALYEDLAPRRSPAGDQPGPSTANHPRLCAGCRNREARYGFRPEGLEVPAFERPRTLCFDCFRVELTRRQLVRERMARGWNGQQVGLPLEDTLRALDKRRRRAQIAARHALGL